AVLDIRFDQHVLAPAGGAELRIALDLLAEAHAARAMNAARHVGRDQRPQVLVLDRALAFGEPRDIAAVAHREILQLALAALIADRTIERMIDQQKFHGRTLRGHRLRRAGEYLHALHHRGGAGRQRLRRLLHLDEAHAAIGGDGELGVIAEAGDVDILWISDLHDHLALPGLQRYAVHFDIDQIVAHRSPLRRHSRLTLDDRTAAVFDHVLKLVPVVLEEALHRPRGRIAQRADRVALDAIGDIHQQPQILAAPLAGEDALQHPIQPARAFAARRALAAGLRRVEARQPLERTHHARRLVHDNHGAGADGGAGFLYLIVIHVRRHHHIAWHHMHRGASRYHGLELAAFPHPARERQQIGKWNAERQFDVAGPRHVTG